jgi:NAD(P)-dependent dehydrogenase (short-subunit alcohol dehydrogenase family)
MTSPSHQSSATSRTVIITGGNTGLGYECARSLLADSRWKVVLACRDHDRGQAAVERLRDGMADAAGGSVSSRVEAIDLDLCSLDSVRAFSQEVGTRLAASKLPPFHALVCNAGVQAGMIKSTFGINHLGHFLLVNLLLPSLSIPARIVVVASGVHDPAQKSGMPAPAWNDPEALARGELGPAAAHDSPATAGQRRYSTSKLANVLFTDELARRLPTGMTAIAFDPGLMPGTGLAREYPAPLRWIWHHVLPRAIPLLRLLLSANIHTPAKSGAALARLVLHPAIEGRNGDYFEGMYVFPSSLESRDPALAAELWQASVELKTRQKAT